jgi:hypothetical protein
MIMLNAKLLLFAIRIFVLFTVYYLNKFVLHQQQLTNSYIMHGFVLIILNNCAN